jgi:hypothetical protein
MKCCATCRNYVAADAAEMGACRADPPVMVWLYAKGEAQCGPSSAGRR